MTLGFCNQIWIPLFTFPTVEAPRFPHGYPAATAFEFGMWGILMFGTWYIPRWRRKHPEPEVLVDHREAEADSLSDAHTEAPKGTGTKVQDAQV